ncbi:hypothetical protein IC230_29460 [Spirosoma sp. BT704]|uniref:DUF5683 domain-containing protein n=2 Tax=Spirosoma validum TaxID=2771355 RepID=A0A927GGM9_9BACT|nr:hypothetical protein [Spirosoma validum]
MVPVWPLFAQKPAITPAPTPAAVDSTRRMSSATDSIPPTVQRNGIKIGTSVLVPDDLTSLDRADTLRLTKKQEAQIHKIIPKKATLKSLMLPGLGQAYNRQYYKIPFIYVGFGVMGYLFVKYSGLANQAEDGYRRLLYGDKISDAEHVSLNSAIYPAALINSVSTPSIKPEYVLIDGYQIRTVSVAKNAYDTYRRYRDLNILLSVALWGINIVEANVAAHLKTFDLSDDISMRIEPNILPLPGAGIMPGVRVAFTFK